VEAEAANSVLGGGSGLEAIVRALRELGEGSAEAGNEGESQVGKTSAVCNVRSWGVRLRLVRAFQSEGADFFTCRCSTRFHGATGLSAVARSVASSEEVWRQVEIRCKREVVRARRLMVQKKKAPDRQLVDACDKIDKMGDDAGARSKQVWKVLAPSRTSAALTKMFVNCFRTPHHPSSR
jgi:hypothetical protein